jgi:subtilisin family serine protease
MANPACISGVTSVAATSSTDDNVTEFSNISNYTTFAAPGYQINSSVSGGGYKQSSGTSMSTPHVAGAFALYNSFKSGLPVTQQVSNLQVNCPKAYDPPTKISVCRLDFTYVASGQVVTPPDTTVPPVDTTVPSPTTTVPSPVVTTPPTTTPPLVYGTMLGKPRLNSIQYYKNNSVSVNYTDPVYAKSLIANYLLICGSTQYTFSPVSGFTNHIYVITLFDSISTSCNLRAVDANGNSGPATQNIPVSK